ncbi:pyridine nucleotide-disulfide oxidoreductase-domain-containing protein [Gamsiella multidivaricata]|uniref:pyridine nucleotide-disulfide oxidoreductase-domain-containing protein n=1 Tax=Gamsiella multidivaricata TaxID=101098 RepID=UPI00221E4D2F|nr:pyridine nucleotide-disulfide oxidoreductase-domain-containing protein [Gamsiella multidivaricata]KAI7820115.1 pyridine nucleotide-disulfide oxidoreductase-domain-containing protein [Gamsiella multidivaricata]
MTAGVPVAGGLAWYTYDTLFEAKGDILHTKRPKHIVGGPKNLVITHGCRGSVLKAEEIHQNDPRQRLVILGSGWGAVSVINQLDPKKFHVTVVSPTNYFLFTPLLPSATVGTLELRSLIEPIRRLLSKLGGYYVEGRAEDIDFENQLVEVSGVNNSEGQMFYVPYDKLVIAVGSESMTHGIQGLEHCNFLKSITDARDIRRKVMENFEKASLPTTTDEERRQLLSFVICGGGPTGVEFAAELYDFLYEDLVGYFPAIPPEEVQVSIIQSAGHILNTYGKTFLWLIIENISEMTEAKFKRESINVVTNARVVKVNPKSVTYKEKSTGKEYEVPFGVCLWSTGVGMTPLVKTLVAKLPTGSQSNKHAIETDGYLRVLGAPEETVYAIGDCATIPQPHFVEKVMTILQENDTNGDNVLNYDEFHNLANKIIAKHSVLKVFLARLDMVFEKYDKDHNGTLDLDEIRAFLVDVEKQCTALPATAQVASQQGKFVGKRINVLHEIEDDPVAAAKLPQFNYTHLGSLAYIGGNEAVLDLGKGYVYGGLGSEYLWRSVYFSEQVSIRTRLLLLMDWSKRALFGRDISKF